MNCLSSQLIITENGEVLRNSVVGFSEDFQPVYSGIQENNHEKAATLFFDGIISPPVYSLVMRGIEITENFQYLNLTDLKPFSLKSSGRLLFDFGTENPAEINQFLKANVDFLSEFSILDIIAGCTAHPGMLLKSQPTTNSIRYLWTGCDLINKKITARTTVSVIRAEI